jgi:lysophospholipase L1-like esterase
MSQAGRARRIVATAAVGSAAVGGGSIGMLWAQALIARRRVGQPRREPFVVTGAYGSWEPDRASNGPAGVVGQACRMAVLGDSGAAGLGAATADETVAVLVANGLSSAIGRPVDLVNLAVVGAQTSHLPAQVEAARTSFEGAGPELVVIMIGTNDVTHRVRPQASVRMLRSVVEGLVAAGCAVVVGCCPDLGTVQPVPNPLRSVGRRLSRTLAAAQALVTTAAGGYPVELGSLLGPEFAARPADYFSEDQFHPSSLGYRRCAEVLLPTVLAALDAREQSAAREASLGDHVCD